MKGVLYVSVWVLLWGTASSLVDWLLLNQEVYASGSAGQVITFIGYGAACVVLAVRWSGRFLAAPSHGEQPSSGDDA
ncbi:hypothetical protein [Synechococcus sp. WH 8101]|uniref:hypothetical protein n=1 Tax=Synechococcus sp. WH 8101 TaxID=59932 RepID=UPI0010234198|nr:hypothetical protein [Synechococcus sp. WH 8101]